MRFRIFTFALVTLLTLFFSAASFAQYDAHNRERVGIRLSAFRPSGTFLKYMGSTWLSPSLDINLKYDQLDRPTALMSIGWFGGEDTTRYAKASMVPVTATYLKYFGNNPDKSWYVGCGAGLYYNKFQTSYDSYTGAKPGINMLGGLAFGGGWFTELRYDNAGSLSAPFGNIDFSGLSICFGTHLGF